MTTPDDVTEAEVTASEAEVTASEAEVTAFMRQTRRTPRYWGYRLRVLYPRLCRRYWRLRAGLRERTHGPCTSINDTMDTLRVHRQEQAYARLRRRGLVPQGYSAWIPYEGLERGDAPVTLTLHPSGDYTLTPHR